MCHYHINGGGNIDVLATQRYSKVVRKVTKLEKAEIEEKRMLHLYPDELITAYRQFPIHEIIDMSFREVGGHVDYCTCTQSEGSFIYTVDSSPMDFIRVFKDYVGK